MTPQDSRNPLDCEDGEYGYFNQNVILFLSLAQALHISLILFTVWGQIKHQCRCMCQAASSARRVGAAFTVFQLKIKKRTHYLNALLLPCGCVPQGLFQLLLKSLFSCQLTVILFLTENTPS